MPLFSPTNPFDGDVERATSESNSSEDWSLITNICNQVEASPNGSKDCLMAIMKRVQHKVPLVAMHALTLLEACVSSCGRPFQVQICSKEFSDDVTKVLEKAHPKVCDRLKAMLVEWWEKFRNDSHMCLLFFIIKNLKDKDIEFPEPGSKEMEVAKAGFGSPGKEPSKGVVRLKEDEDLAKAIELSIKEQRQYPSLSGVGGASSFPGAASAVGPALASPPSLYPQAVVTSVPLGAPSGVVRKVRALYDFEAAEDNELTFKAGDMLTVLDDSDANWWKGETESGLGLFPSNFVTADLTAEPDNVRRYEVREEPEEVPCAEPDPEPLSINEERMDQVLHMLQSLDPKDDRPDGAELLRLEESCHQMGPLIDQKLEEIDRKHSELSEMNVNLGDAISLYNRLMKEAPFYSPYSKMHPEHQYYPGQQPAGVSQNYAGPSGAHYAPPQGYVAPNEQPLPLSSLTQYPAAPPPHGQPTPQHSANPSIGVGSVPAASHFASLPPAPGQTAAYAPPHPYGAPQMPPAFSGQQPPSGYPLQQHQYPAYPGHNRVTVNPGVVSAQQPIIHAQGPNMQQPLL